MKRVLFAMVLGGVLGVLDGLGAWFTPEVRPELGMIVVGSSLKSVVAGLLIGIFAGYVKGRMPVILFGLAIGVLFGYLVAMQPDALTGKHYYAEIMLPGGLVGLLVGFATQRYAAKQALQATSAKEAR